MDYKSSILKNWLEGGNGERRQKMREWGIRGRTREEGEGGRKREYIGRRKGKMLDKVKVKACLGARINLS